jgi:hypothetical protein
MAEKYINGYSKYGLLPDVFVKVVTGRVPMTLT